MKFTRENIRNITVMGHGGAGKTAFVEAALFNAGVINRIGKSNEGNTVSDFDAEEIRRGISINTSLAAFEWKKNKINLIDTPGDFDFLGEQMLGMDVGDAVLIVMSAKDGVAVGVEKAVRLARNEKMPISFLINRMDEPNADFEATLEALREEYGHLVIPMTLPIMDGETMTGLVDVVSMKAYSFSGNKGEMKAAEMSADLQDLAESYHEQLVEQIAESDEELMEKYFEGEAFTPAEEERGLRKAISQASLYPVFAGSANVNWGISHILDLMIRFFPTPEDGHAMTVVDRSGESFQIKTDQDGPLAALVFKTIVDPFVGKISLFRVYSGVFEDSGSVYNVNKETDERINGLYTMCGKKQISVDSVIAGDIGATTKLNDTSTLDTLTDRDNPLKIEAPEMPTPSLTLAISAVNEGEDDKIMQGLVRLKDEDIVFDIENNPETHQFLLSGLGEVQLDVLTAKLKGKFAVEARLTEPRVAYRETITQKVKVQGRHKKQTGGHGQFGDVWIEFEPGDDLDLDFQEKIFGGSVPKNYFPAVEKGLREAIDEGPLAGYPVVNLRATLVDGSYHDVDSNEMSFKLAARLAYRNGMPQAKPILLEPIYSLSVHIPDDFLGDIMGDLSKRRGSILGINPDTIPGFQVVEAEVPAAEIAKYATDLKSMTQGRGYFTREMARYEPVPQNISDKIVAAASEEE
ncbi:MAG: elongation factor G [Clostridiaceae bacterium]|jgi:elongation factor G|nr:elongation factor G [Clostridiaceae bacterium]